MHAFDHGERPLLTVLYHVSNCLPFPCEERQTVDISVLVVAMVPPSPARLRQPAWRPLCLGLLHLVVLCCLSQLAEVEAGNCTAISCPNSICTPTANEYTCSCPAYFVAVNTTVEPEADTFTCRAACALAACTIECPAGWMCNRAVATAAQPVYAKLCPLGKLCTDNTIAPVDCPKPPESNQTHYCPTGSIVGILCPAGFYCELGNITAPIPCELGSSCIAGTAEPHVCQASDFCPSTSQAPISCPPGRYCPTTNLTSPLRCPAGFSCESTGTITPVLCQPSQYCPPSTGRPAQCDAGSYCATPSTREKCPAGYFCPSGTINPIRCNRVGSFCPNGSMSEGTCAAGFWCATPAAPSIPCVNGTYCSSGVVSPSICAEGFYCGNEAASEMPCSVGQLCPAGAGAPQICPKGDWCTFTQATTCEPGENCALGILSTCQPGNVCQGGISEACPPGFTCPEKGMSEPIPCEQGRYDSREGVSGHCEGVCGFWFQNNEGATSCNDLSKGGLAIIIVGALCVLAALLYVGYSVHAFSVRRMIERRDAEDAQRAAMLQATKDQIAVLGPLKTVVREASTTEKRLNGTTSRLEPMPRDGRKRSRSERLQDEVERGKILEARSAAVSTIVAMLVKDCGTLLPMVTTLPESNDIDCGMVAACFQNALRIQLMHVLSSQSLSSSLDLEITSEQSGADAIPSLHSALAPALEAIVLECFEAYRKQLYMPPKKTISGARAFQSGSISTRGEDVRVPSPSRMVRSFSASSAVGLGRFRLHSSFEQSVSSRTEVPAAVTLSVVDAVDPRGDATLSVPITDAAASAPDSLMISTLAVILKKLRAALNPAAQEWRLTWCTHGDEAPQGDPGDDVGGRHEEELPGSPTFVNPAEFVSAIPVSAPLLANSSAVVLHISPEQQSPPCSPQDRTRPAAPPPARVISRPRVLIHSSRMKLRQPHVSTDSSTPVTTPPASAAVVARTTTADPTLSQPLDHDAVHLSISHDN